MACAFGWFLDELMNVQPTQCCDCLLDEATCPSACELKGCKDEDQLITAVGLATGSMGLVLIDEDGNEQEF